ncbi:MAG: fused MFS/spermidine synthase [Bacteroidales bacterium]|nr:fused MFS/spermidine synthase [Bacteroidales bacterium]
MKKHFLEIVVFVCGAVVMIYEVAGSRVLGPYLGTSIFIWTSLIGIILGSLSLGYWLGGRMADRKPTFSALAWIILLAAVLIGITTLIKEPFLIYLPRFISGIKWQSVMASIILFAPASVFLGMVSPYAVRLKIKELKNSGATVGQLYAISTVGSIAGTFAAGFYLIPAMGTTNIFIAITILLALISITLFIPEKKTGNSIPSILLILVTVYFFFQKQSKALSYIDEDTQYSRVWIYDAVDQATGKPIKFMRINNESSSAMFLDNDELVFPYSKFYRLAEHFTPGFKSTLILGGAAFSYPKYFLWKYPEATIDVVEIDPELTRMARDHFRMKDDPRMRIFHEDARTFLNRAENKYDVIYGDAYKSLYTVPWHLTTREAAQKSFNMLNDGGCVLLNIISSVEGNSSLFLQAELATYRDVFPHVYVFAVMDPSDRQMVQSMILLASKSTESPASNSEDPEIASYLQHDVTSQISASLPVLTDEFAPVDFYTNKAIK